MADVVEAMLEGSRELLGRDDRRLAVQLRRMDDVLDRLHGALKRYLGELAQAELSDEERSRLVWILAVALNLEHAGDIIDKGLLDLAAKRIRRRLRFTHRELAQTETMHEHLLAQLRLAVAVFMAEDLQAALRLVEEKERFRELERAATEAQFARLHGRPAQLRDERPSPRHRARPEARRSASRRHRPSAARAEQPAALEPLGAALPRSGCPSRLASPHSTWADREHGEVAASGGVVVGRSEIGAWSRVQLFEGRCNCPNTVCSERNSIGGTACCDLSIAPSL